MSDKVFSHSGDNGDLIAALPTVKALGGGKLVLFPASYTGYRMTRERAESLRPLLECQEYVHGVEWREGPEGVNLDQWRNHYRNNLNLSDMVNSTFGLPPHPREEPWLTVPDVKRLARVVFHRSPRYQNWNMVPTWKRAWEQYRWETIFVGTPEEHAAFCTYIGPVPYYPTRDYLDLAKVIAGCDLYMGNQSSPFWVAEGLKKRLVLEACMNPQNCHFGRAGFTYGVNEWTALPDLYDVAGHTLLTQDRLDVIAASVKETAMLAGDMAEVGVYRGGSARVIATAAPDKLLHLFDTFTGIPADDDAPEGHRKGDFAASLPEVRRYLQGLNVAFHPGVFPTTTAGLGDVRYSFVHLDGDLYQTTADALDYFLPRMTPGGIIVLDDLDWQKCPGVRRAVDERGLTVETTAAQQGRLVTTGATASFAG